MYEELLREAEREGVEVISWSLKGKTKGLYDRDDRSKGYSKYRNGLKGLEKQRRVIYYVRLFFGIIYLLYNSSFYGRKKTMALSRGRAI